MTAADWQALAEWVTAASVLTGGVVWLGKLPKAMTAWFDRRRHKKLTSVLNREVTAGEAWEDVKKTPEVSMEAGIAFGRAAARSGHPPHTPTQGLVTPEQPLDYLLAKTGETVWEAAGSAHSDLESYLVPVRNYMAALVGNAGLTPARDFALGVLTERVRQEEDGWPDQPGTGKRTAHNVGDAHLCLLERKHEVEDAIYQIGS